MFTRLHRQSPAVTRAEVRRIWKYLLPGRTTAAQLLFCLIATSVLGVLPPYLVKTLIDTAIPNKDIGQVNWLIAGLVVLPTIGGLIGVWQEHILTTLSLGVTYRLREELYESVLRQSRRFFVSTRSGEVLSRLHTDTAAVQGMVRTAFVTCLANVFILASTLVVMFHINAALTWAACGILPLFAIPTRHVGERRREQSRHTQQCQADVSSHVSETLSVDGSLLVRLFGAEEYEHARFKDKLGRARDSQLGLTMLGRWFFWAVSLFGTVGPAMIYFLGSREVIADRMSVGTMVAFVAYLGRMYGPTSGVAGFHVEFMTAAAVFRRLFEYLDLTPEVANCAAPLTLGAPRGDLQFSSVWMNYHAADRDRADAWKLRDIDFSIGGGEVVALVGPSGAGKSTIAGLACRLYDPTLGSVRIDGVDVRRIDLRSLTHLIGYVTQDTTLLNATIEDNLRYAKRTAAPEELRRACELAHLDDLLARLPDGFQTVVGERGFKLSGGERQRLALARIILRDPPILILDEATSALDSHSEKLVQRALEIILPGRTSLVIAHRLTTVINADRILVLDGGCIVEEGTHDALRTQKGLYARFCAEQLRPADTLVAVAPN